MVDDKEYNEKINKKIELGIEEEIFIRPKPMPFSKDKIYLRLTINGFNEQSELAVKFIEELKPHIIEQIQHEFESFVENHEFLSELKCLNSKEKIQYFEQAYRDLFDSLFRKDILENEIGVFKWYSIDGRIAHAFGSDIILKYSNKELSNNDLDPDILRTWKHVALNKKKLDYLKSKTIPEKKTEFANAKDFESLFKDKSNAKKVKDLFEIKGYTCKGEWLGLSKNKTELLAAYYVLKPLLKGKKDTPQAKIFYETFNFKEQLSDRSLRTEPFNEDRCEFERIFNHLLHKS